MEHTANEYIVPVGLFSGDNRFKMDTQIFIDQKPNYYEFANKTPTMTGALVFEEFTETPHKGS